ncbi:(2E,6E)-farnesyl diphosphate synthase [Pseudoalteromonas denitrificans]|uniref:(2E,6E)-farnesyl diphosphate synthase n=1 Tax=Pseudoalteromonas denitrificans TaxID=43656 RepID=UPI000B86538D
MNIKPELICAQNRITLILNNLIDNQINTDDKLKSAAKYSLLNGGKRLRPLLVYLTGKMLNANDNDLDIAAGAIECIHSYSLVHDDLPAMDDDNLRRGKPTCHIKFDEATAILAGDALQTLAFESLASHQFIGIDHKQQISLISTLAQASGLTGMCGGQSLDLSATDKLITLEQLEHIHNLKTGALLRCAIKLGALCSPNCTSDILDKLDCFGKAIGLAFQVQDDILDIEADTQTLGKPQGSDVASNKSTYPALLGLQGAKNKARQLYLDALKALEHINADTSELEALATYIIERDH